MKQYMSATRLVTKLKMLRSGKQSKSFIVVEGITDARLYGKFIDAQYCEVIIADSKPNVIGCIKAFNKEQTRGIIGITDSDFDRLNVGEELETVPHLFLTDAHDLECMLLDSDAFENVCIEYADKQKCHKFEEKIKCTIREHIMMQATIIGYLKLYSIKYQLGLRFTNIEFEQFINLTTLEVDLRNLIEHVLFISKKVNSMNSEELLEEIDNMMNVAYDKWQICCGHDLMVLMNLGLTHIYGDYNAKNLFPAQLEGNFRLAYTKEDFKNTLLYKKLLVWQEEEKDYRIF